jgi:hypothetical protein
MSIVSCDPGISHFETRSVDGMPSSQSSKPINHLLWTRIRPLFLNREAREIRSMKAQPSQVKPC